MDARELHFKKNQVHSNFGSSDLFVPTSRREALTGPLQLAACQPPSTNRVWPLIKSEAGLARKSAAPTKSEGTAKRPSFIRLRNRSPRASFSRNVRLVLSVSVAVGAMAFTRTPKGAHSVERAAVR